MDYYGNEKLNISRRDIALYDLVDQYQTKRLLFPDISIATQKKQVLTREAIDALLYGVPYPEVYVSETQYGEYIVLETDNRLKCLVEFIAGKFSLEMTGLSLGNEEYFDLYYDERRLKVTELDSRHRQDILRSRIQLCVIEYGTPLYMHLRIGSYIGNWTVYQEEAVRRTLYSNRGIERISSELRANPKTQSGLLLEAEIVVFLTYIVNFKIAPIKGEKRDQYYLQERMLKYFEMHTNELYEWMDILYIQREGFKGTLFLSHYGMGKTSLFRIFEDRFPQFKPGRGHLLGLAACVAENPYQPDLLSKAHRIMEKACDVGYDRDLYMLFTSSDMSNYSLSKIIDELRCRI